MTKNFADFEENILSGETGQMTLDGLFYDFEVERKKMIDEGYSEEDARKIGMFAFTQMRIVETLRLYHEWLNDD